MKLSDLIGVITEVQKGSFKEADPEITFVWNGEADRVMQFRTCSVQIFPTNEPFLPLDDLTEG